MRVFYGVTEDGIHGAWRRLVEAEDRRTPEALAAAAETPAPAGEAPDFAEPLAPEPVALAEEAVAEMVADEQHAVAEMAAVPAHDAPEAMPSVDVAPEPVDMAPAEPPAKRRSRGGRSTKKTAAKSVKTPAASRPARKTTKAKAPATSRPRSRRTAQTAE